ncbi:hypothetical protein [Nostoc sp.]
MSVACWTERAINERIVTSFVEVYAVSPILLEEGFLGKTAYPVSG